MALKFSHRKEEEVPSAVKARQNPDYLMLKTEMSRLESGMVLEIETGNEQANRGTKMLVTRAARELGTDWRHWSAGSKVFAKPAEAGKRRGRPKKSA